MSATWSSQEIEGRAREVFVDCYATIQSVPVYERMFDDWLESVRAEARKPRVIETADELDKLPEGAVVLDGDGDPWKKQEGGAWFFAWGDYSGDWLANYHKPLTVLWEGGE